MTILCYIFERLFNTMFFATKFEYFGPLTLVIELPTHDYQ
jgi:hypothetical protein